MSPASTEESARKEEWKEGRKESKRDAQQAASGSRVPVAYLKDDFTPREGGLRTHSDKALEVLLSSTRRKPAVIFSACALLLVLAIRRGLVPTPDAVIFAELPSLLGGDLPLSFPTEKLRVLSPTQAGSPLPPSF